MKRFVLVTNSTYNKITFHDAPLSTKNNFFNALMIFGDMRKPFIK